MSDAGKTIALNRSEHTYLALEGVAGSVNQVYVLRFGSQISVEAMRGAVRALVRAFPRMRAVLEPTLFSQRLRVLADDDIDDLFDDAFRVVPNIDADLPALEALATEQLNDAFALERGLPMRARFVPSGETSALVLMVHHVVCDGRSMIMLVESLLRALNGHALPACAIDPPTMLPAILPSSPAGRLASLWRSFLVERARARRTSALRVARLGAKTAPRFGTFAVHIHRLPVGMAALRKASSARGSTVTALVIAALAEAFGHGLPEDGKNAVAVRLSVDLRKYYPEGRAPGFGNYVATFFVLATIFDTARAMADVGAQLKEGLARFEQKVMSYPLVLASVFARIGRKLFNMAALASKRRGSLPPMTCHYSNLGNVDSLNARDAQIRLAELHATAPNVGPFVVTSGLGDTLALTISYARNEVTEAEVYALLERLDDAMRSIAREAATPAQSSTDVVRIAS